MKALTNLAISVATAMIVVLCACASLLRIFWYPNPHRASLAGTFEVGAHALVFGTLAMAALYGILRRLDLINRGSGAFAEVIPRFDRATSICLWAVAAATAVEAVMFFRQVPYPWFE